jgi:TPP-dependent pyruvate/acetoin dehydrogenase alpha subunit
LEFWQTRDPLLVAGAELLASGAATQAELDSVTENAQSGLAELVEQLLDAPGPTPSDMFKNIFAEAD